MKRYYCIICILCIHQTLVNAQGQLSGDFESNVEFYQRDSLIGAYGTPHYDNLLTGVNGWLNVYYQNQDQGFEAGIRLDVFNNSNLHNPGTPYTAQGIGRWYVKKKLDNLTISGGYLYDQIANGLIFRSYEERPLGIDNALFGLQLEYQLTTNLTLKAFAGQQKDLFSTYKPVIKGGTAEYTFGNGTVNFVPGVSILNRTLDQDNMNTIVSTINSYPVEERFVPAYNMYAGSYYHTLNVKNIAWNLELAFKSEEAVRATDGNLFNANGYAAFTALSYSVKGFGITGQFRKVQDWAMRVSPNEVLLDGILDYLPAMSRQNSTRLTARYQAVAQELGENAFQFNVTYTPSKGNTLGVNYSQTFNADTLLFREIYADYEMRRQKYKLLIGAQYIQYNQEVFEFKPNAPMVEPITPFAEFTYKLDRKKSLRIEAQYQYNDHDYGSWIFALLEFNIAPQWSFTASDMWNYKPLKTVDALHYPMLAAVYTYKASRFSLSYVKQTEGIVCTGGVCRYEPAFSGYKFGILTNF
ncbi:MAG: hypothetical protein IPG60_04205 [Bacteroidetes bacterium]|nr:hypothetical protein [Bacteroidota bacterium]MBP7397956.1 hypothetical protein [Chitinophagales bacterium]MBK7108914.1 hypothetical protein [Bacteroidota bacterium]MBK8488760.1 hypothetical protein [Bacteroidota bacterium]MBK8681483.1 hypothetical protein [Bacteroidota bacterium]